MPKKTKAISTKKKVSTKIVANKLPPKTKFKVTKTGLVEVPIEAEEVKKSNKKYIKVPENAAQETFNDMGLRVMRKEVKWSYYAIENFVGMHYYLVL